MPRRSAVRKPDRHFQHSLQPGTNNGGASRGTRSLALSLRFPRPSLPSSWRPYPFLRLPLPTHRRVMQRAARLKGSPTNDARNYLSRLGMMSEGRHACVHIPADEKCVMQHTARERPSQGCVRVGGRGSQKGCTDTRQLLVEATAGGVATGKLPTRATREEGEGASTCFLAPETTFSRE